MLIMKSSLLALALAVAATGAFAGQTTNAVVSGVFQGQVGSLNTQRMDVGSINTSNTNVITNVNANQLWQLQGGTRNLQVLQVGTVLPSASGATALRTNATVTGAVLQIQGGSDNSQRARIGVIH
jgi:predicted RecA/RadA family phage recombinase